MDAAEAIQIYRSYKYCYHGLIRSPMRCGYIEACQQIKVIYSMQCENLEGGHLHVHYLFCTDLSPAALNKRLQRVEQQKVDEYNRCLRVDCEKYFCGIIHYFHCPMGQKKTHRHQREDGILHEAYLHRFNQSHCDGVKSMITTQAKWTHPEDCPCKTRATKFWKMVHGLVTRKEERTTFIKKLKENGGKRTAEAVKKDLEEKANQVACNMDEDFQAELNTDFSSDNESETDELIRAVDDDFAFTW